MVSLIEQILNIASTIFYVTAFFLVPLLLIVYAVSNLIDYRKRKKLITDDSDEKALFEIKKLKAKTILSCIAAVPFVLIVIGIALLLTVGISYM